MIERNWYKAFRGKDNETPDIGRWLWAACTVVFLGLTVYTVVIKSEFDYITFAIACATILAGGGAGLKIKETTEPSPKV